MAIKDKNIVAFGGRLKAFRLLYGLSQKELAAKLGIEPKTYSSYETGERFPPSDRIVSICETLNTTPNVLFGFSEKDEPIFLNITVGDIANQLRKNIKKGKAL